MNNVLPNGEPKKILLTKPTEEAAGNENAGPSTSSTSSSPPPYRPLKGYVGKRVRIPARRYPLPPPVDKNPEEHLTNQKKQRYWNSWEELYIVELWRRYRDEVTAINVPLPVYRKIMIAMRNRNMLVTAQDCRRKINTLHSKYTLELKRLESSGGKSDWRLFPLLQCVMTPKVKEFDPWHETKIIKNLLDKIPKPVEVKPPPPPVPISPTNYQPQPARILQTFQPNITTRSSVQQPLNTSIQSATASHTNMPSSPANKLPYKPSILPFRNITWEKLEQIRQDNVRLALERDDTLQLLHIEEREFQYFESYIQSWKEQKELELQNVQKMSRDYVFNIENEENHTVEQQSVCVK